MIKPITREQLFGMFRHIFPNATIAHQHSLQDLSLSEPNAAEQPSSTSPTSPNPPNPPNPPLILIAEDNVANMRVLSEYLTEKGYRIATAANGTEAIAQTRDLRPALILMDIQMPGLDGLEATRHIRASQELAAIPIIVLTALMMPGDRERCFAAGVNEYVSKPISLKRLSALLQHYLQPEE